MDLQELIEFIDKENIRLKDHYHDHDTEKEKLILYRAVKLGEEFGELCNEILITNSSQRKEKMVNAKSNLEDEFADVLFTSLLLARLMDVDVEKSIRTKIEKINKRYEKIDLEEIN